MCGIYGTTLKTHKEKVLGKLALINHRGPDFTGVANYEICGGNVLYLGHVRLSIIDIDVRSNQPFDYNENISIVFNGEIYNYQELKAKYFGGKLFRSQSDTEVICALYEKFGSNCVQYMNGMFAFVIYDKKNSILFGARDRLGKKPFYYLKNNDGFEFCSQISPISCDKNLVVNELSRKFYILNGYIPDPYTIYNEVQKLRAGCCFTYNLNTTELSIEQYWDIDSNTSKFQIPSTYEEAKDTIRDLITDAVRLRLRSDVPVGMFLSGGIDSSLTAGIISKLNNNIHAYSIGFNDAAFNESDYAKDVANHLGIPLEVTMCEGEEMKRVFSDYEKYFDEPFADHSLIPTSLLCEKARYKVTVAVGGDGGDELFFGYYRYLMLSKKEKFYKIPYVLRKSVYDIIHHYSGNHNIDLLRYTDLQESFIGRGDYGFLYDTATFDAISLSKSLPDVPYLYRDRGLLAYSDYDMKHYLNSCINTKTDRASMRTSLELRSPLMDYRLAEYSRLLPLEYVYDNNTGGKRILKDLLYEMVPRELVDRPKTGFVAPVGGWFRGDLKEHFLDIFTTSNIEKYLPELDAVKTINLRDKFLGDMPVNFTTIFKYYSYIKWGLLYLQ